MHVLIVGASRGIGLALTQLCLAEGCQVTATCRTATTALRNTGATVVDDIDVTQDTSATRLREVARDAPPEIAIVCAGILERSSLDDLAPASVQRQFETNALGPLRIVHALLPTLAAGAKIALITSRMGSIADNTSGGAYGYRMSKAALNAMGKSLAIDLRPRDIAVALLHPGFVQTDMTDNRGDVTAQASARDLWTRITHDLTRETSGTFWHANGEILPW